MPQANPIEQETFKFKSKKSKAKEKQLHKAQQTESVGKKQ